MKPLIFITILLIPLSAHAEMLDIEPVGHFAMASGATYIITDICSKHTGNARYCLFLGAGLVMLYATWEINNLPGFDRRSYYFDLIGAPVGIVIWRW